MTPEKRILFLTPLPPPEYGSAKSSQTCLEILQNDEKYKVINVKLNYSENFDDIGKYSVKKIFGVFIVFTKIIYYSFKFKPDLVYFMPATSGKGFLRDLFFIMPFKFLNSQILFHLRTQIALKSNKFLLKRLIFKIIFYKSKAIVLGNDLVEELLQFLPRENIFILPNAISGNLNENDFNKISMKRIQSNQFNLLFLSNMMESKGWKKVLDTALTLKESGVDFNLTFAGNWVKKTDETYFRNFTMQSGLSNNIKHVGFANDAMKHELLSSSDVLIFPTEYEAFGRVIIEAMEYGIPVIANSVGSIPNIIIHHYTGFLLTNNSPEEIKDYIEILLNRDKRKIMSDNSRGRFLENYELKIFKQNFQLIINQVVIENNILKN